MRKGAHNTEWIEMPSHGVVMHRALWGNECKSSVIWSYSCQVYHGSLQWQSKWDGRADVSRKSEGYEFENAEKIMDSAYVAKMSNDVTLPDACRSHFLEEITSCNKIKRYTFPFFTWQRICYLKKHTARIFFNIYIYIWNKTQKIKRIHTEERRSKCIFFLYLFFMRTWAQRGSQ